MSLLSAPHDTFQQAALSLLMKYAICRQDVGRFKLPHALSAHCRLLPALRCWDIWCSQQLAQVSGGVVWCTGGRFIGGVQPIPIPEYELLHCAMLCCAALRCAGLCCALLSMQCRAELLIVLLCCWAADDGVLDLPDQLTDQERALLDQHHGQHFLDPA